MRNLRVRLLGDLDVEGCDPARLGRRQVRTVLKVLALGRGRPVSVDRLADALWGDDPPVRAADQISVLVSRLRTVVGPGRVRRSDAGYLLAVDWLDVDALADYAAEADRRLADGAVGAAGAAAAAGLSLLRGPLLADEPAAAWAAVERSAVERLASRLQHVAAAAALAGEQWASAADLASGSLTADPYDESALRLLMEGLARSGRPASALAAYATARGRLADDLGVSPSAATEALHTAILLGEVPGSGETEVAPTASIAELPGRAEALHLLDSIFDRVAGGRGMVVFVEGEAGIGKSRLLRVWSSRLTDRAHVAVATCDELGRSLPLQPLLDAVDQLARRHATGDGVDALEEVLGADVAVLGPLLGAQAAPADSARLAALTDPGAGRSLLLAAIFSVMRRQAAVQPLVLIIDDAHLADSATTVWLAQASKRLADTRIAVVAARRSEEAVPVHGVTTLTLGPLDLEAAALIVGPQRAATLHARSGGHPLFLVELSAADTEGELPASIRDAVEDRCRRAGAAAPTLRAAAVIGPVIDLDVLAAATGASPGELLDHLEDGVRRRLLIEDGATFTFTHALVREALASTVSASRAALIHREAARALAARPGSDPLTVARHARLGGELAQASAMLVIAAHIAVTRFDAAEAVRLLDEAVSLEDSVGARLERARVHSMLARYDLATDDLAAARAGGAGAETLEIAAWSAHFQRKFGEALVLADSGAREATDPDVRTSCAALAGWVSLATGDIAGSETRLEAAVEGAPPGAAHLAEAWLAWLRTNQCRPDDTLRLARAAPGTGLATYRFPNAYAQMAATMALAMLGRPDEALATVDALTADVARMGAQRWTPRPLNLRGWIVRNLGGFAEADELNQAAIEAARPLALAEPLANALLDLATGRLLVGDLDRAAALLDEAAPLSQLEHAFRWRHELRGRLVRARLDLAYEQPLAALDGAEGLAADAASLGTPRYEVQARLVAAIAGHRSGMAVDRRHVDGLLIRLGEVAGLEAWWITRGVAQEFGVDAWAQLAGERLAGLARRAGAYAMDLGRASSRPA